MSDDRAPVSPNNPCPFLRALVESGRVDNERASLVKLAKTIKSVAKTADTQPSVPFAAVYAIAAIANGLGPLNVLNNQLHGVRLNELRGGPLDKKGAGSGILNEHAEFQEEQMDRLLTFATSKTGEDGASELGLDEQEINQFMDANFDRAKRFRRSIDRRLMNGEWPVLLKVLGKKGTDGLYLAVDDVVQLFKYRQFPKRMIDRMRGGA